jgi:hypothetical protein
LRKKQNAYEGLNITDYCKKNLKMIEGRNEGSEEEREFYRKESILH